MADEAGGSMTGVTGHGASNVTRAIGAAEERR